MPQRFLRPGITNSDRWNKVSFEAQSLFIRILTLVDDFGRFDARVAILHGQCFALRNDVKPQRTAAMRNELQNARLIDVYEVAGREFLQVEQWQERARQDKSKFPDKPQVVDISTPAADGGAPLPNPASIDHRPSPLHPIPSTIAIVPAKPDASGYAVPACFEKVEGFSVALAGWIEMRNKKRNPPTGNAIQILVNRLAEKPERAIEGLNAAIESGWATVKWEWLDNRNRSNGKPKSETFPLTDNGPKGWKPGSATP